MFREKTARLKSARIIAAFFAFVLFIAMPNGARAKDEWIEARTANFALVGDASETEMRQAARTLERFRETFRLFFDGISLNPNVPIRVVVFKNVKSLDEFKAANLFGKSDSGGGFFQNGRENSFIVVAADGKQPVDYQRIFHDYAHFFINENLGRSNIPPWIGEGLAAYFETARFEIDGRTVLGETEKAYLSRLEANKLIPFEAFLNQDYYSLARQGNHGAAMFDAQAWALIHYLLHAENKSGGLKKFVRLLVNGKNPKYVFKEAFQVEPDRLEAELRRYVERKNFTNAAIDLKINLPPDGEIKFATLSLSKAKITLGDLLYEANRFDRAAGFYEEALRLENNSSRAHSALGLARLKQGKTDEAARLFEKAVNLDEADFLAHYRLAFFLSREAMTEYEFVSNYTAASADRMRESLEKSIALDPDFPESRRLLAFVNYIRRESLDEAIESLERALQFAPGRQEFLIHQAELLMLKEDFNRARRIAEKIYETAPDERLRVYAKNTIYTIDNYESQMASVRNPNRRKLSRDVTDQPLTDEEAARLNWLAQLESINQSLRPLRANEKRVLGYLVRVECQANRVEYFVETEEERLKLISENFDALHLMSYSPDAVGGQVGCGTPSKAWFAVIGYRPSAKGKSANEIVSIEFVPKNFRLFD